MNDIKKAALIKEMQKEFLKVAQILTTLENNLYSKTTQKAA